MAVRFPLQKFFFFSLVLAIHFSIENAQAKPREIKQTRSSETFKTANGKEVGALASPADIGIQDKSRELECLTSGITSIISKVTNSLTSILGEIKNSTSGLGDLTSLLKKPGGFNLTAIFTKPPGCNPIDPLLIANIPGIFFWTPVVILLISIMVGIVAAIAIAIGGLGSHITDAINEMIKDKMNQGGYEDSSYGVPSSSYGSTGSSYSRLETVNQLTDNFSQAYDKYSALTHSQQTPYQQNQKDQKTPQSEQQIFKDYYENQSQYDQWNQVSRSNQKG